MAILTVNTSVENQSESKLSSLQIKWKPFIIITLFLSIWASAFAIVYTTYATRHSFAELQSLRQQNDNLFMEWTQLLLEQSSWTDAGSIQQIASEELEMVFPAAKNIEFLVISS